ncbi:MAG: hypothetical protein ACYDEZ_07130 [Methanoregula sp.]|jgi:hypothetical protein
MSSTKTAGTSTAFRTLQQGQFPPTGGIAGSGGDSLSPAFTDTGDAGVTDRFSDLFRMTGINLSPDEFNELKIFEEFLERHVEQNRICDVQCMLLWSEWVRTFRRQASGFPNLIRENEFRSVITGKFSTGISTDGWRGAVYTGVRFVP